jgi:Bacteriophage head to tail connecting protein.
MDNGDTTIAAARYELLRTERDPFLKMGREMASLTIPGILPPEGARGGAEMPQPYQSVGADGVNNLSSKITLTLFPPGESFFRLTMDDFVLDEMRRKAGDDEQFERDRSTFEEQLGRIERAVINRMEQRGNRALNFTAAQHLIVTGNGLIQVLKDGGEKFHALDRYVVKRDLSGNVLEIIVKEPLARLALPPAAEAIVAKRSEKDDPKATEQNVDLYTWVRRVDGGGYKVHQEIDGQLVPGSEGSYPAGKSAWIPLRWRAIPGEDYGRGHCEEYAGDLRSLESLQKSIVKFAAAAAKVLFLVNPQGTTSKRKIAGADSGDIEDGDARDVTVLQMEKFADFRVAHDTKEEIRKRLEKAFLLTSAVQRDAERVTAEEIRVMVNELEQGLGGVYTLLGTELQRPLVVRIMHQMASAGQLPHLPDNAVAPQIVTGVEGLGRASETQRLDMLVANVGQLFGPETVAKTFNPRAYMRRKAAGLSLDVGDLVYTEEQAAQMQQQAMLAQATEKLGPSLIGAMSKGAEQPQQTPQEGA